MIVRRIERERIHEVKRKLEIDFSRNKERRKKRRKKQTAKRLLE